MAKLKLNRAVEGLSGALDGWVYRQVNGQTVVATRPYATEREPSQAQRAQRERFRAAAAYARRVLADPCQRRVYEAMAAKLKRRADKMLASDYLLPPKVEHIDLTDYHGRPGDLIRVIATDDLAVASVQVGLTTAAGTVLEQGPATEVHGVWIYTATLVAPPGERLTVAVTAKDRPGHEGVGTAVYP